MRLSCLFHHKLLAVSDIDVMREVLGDVVIYFDPYDEKDIASALKKLITEVKNY